MSLFEVKGWDVPSKGVVTTSQIQQSRKRKRIASDFDKVHSAQVNFEKLIREVGKGGVESTQSTRKRQKHQGNTKGRGDNCPSMERENPRHRHNASKKRQDNIEKGVDKMTNSETETFTEVPSTPVRKRGSQNLSVAKPQHPMQRTLSSSTSKQKTDGKPKAVDGLTTLQSRMKAGLHGSRFRWINEVLYTTSSAEGRKLMREDPKLYEEYHVGFRQQVRSWPSNPISHYIAELSSYPQDTVIADLGCGDAALAKSLIRQGYCVLSFDLVPDGVFVLEADICERIPLPGAADGSQGQIVDVCICALSLMSLDWMKCIRETWRILRRGGELKIAEVTSRFTNVDQFLSIVERIGYKFKSKDNSNTHFTLFEFEKLDKEPLNEKEWEDLRLKNSVLKPCEYKRR